MKYFKLTVAFALALAFMFAIDCAVEFCSHQNIEWYTALVKPTYAPSESVWEIGFLVALSSLTIGATICIVRPQLRKSLMVLGGYGISTAFFVLSLYVWKLIYLALSFATLSFAALVALCLYYIKNTKEVWLATILPLSWHAYLTWIAYTLCILN